MNSQLLAPPADATRNNLGTLNGCYVRRQRTHRRSTAHLRAT